MVTDSMDVWWYAVVAMILYSVLFWALDPLIRKLTRLPPGPRRVPIIGSIGTILELGSKLHDSLQIFHALYEEHGPIVFVSLGVKKLVIISSSDLAKQILQTHDKYFTGRVPVESSKVMDHYKTSFVFAQPGPHLRLLRRISATDLFSPKKLLHLGPLRRHEISHVIHQVFQQSHGNCSINMRDLLLKSTLHLLGKMVFSIDMFDMDSPNFTAFKDSLAKYVERGGTPTVVDFFPLLRPLDPQGVLRDTEFHMNKVYAFIDSLIQKRLKCQHSKDRSNDFLDTLINLRDRDFTHSHIRAFITDLSAAGTDTSTVSMEWAMAEVIRNPKVMAKAQAELDDIVGKERVIQESDMERLPYLRAIVKETLRMHPPTPVLIPHRAEKQCEVVGYVVPKDATILVNYWSISRDPSMWKDPQKFTPERFLNANIDFKGQNFQFIPFGSGRRMCVGLPLANVMLHSILGALIQCFEWSLPDGEAEIDMSGKFGITLHKTTPLVAIATPRLLPAHLYHLA